MQKIFVDKQESTSDILKRVKTVNDQVVMLVVPTDSKLKTSANFRSLKKNSLEMGKSIIIESVDEKILSLASAAQLEAIHPFLSNRMNKSLADIVMAPKVKRDSAAKEPRALRAQAGKREKSPYLLRVKDSGEHAIPIPVKKDFDFKIPFSWKKIIWPAALLLLILIAGVVANAFFAKAEITVSFNKIPWNMEHSFTAATSLPKDQAQGYEIPGQLLVQDKNIAQLFPASGKANVSQKTTAQITVYNAYSSSPQTLIHNTRFTTPDGKIYRTDSDTIVPAASMQNGKLAPSSIKVGVTADQAGPDYNSGPIPKLMIPGFAGTPKYQGFYGVMENGASGGFIGMKAVATDQDVASAEQRATEMLQSAFQNVFMVSVPKDLKIIDGASELKILKMTADKNTNADGNFTVFGEAEFRSIAFREEDLKNLIQNQAISGNQGYKFESFSLSYSNAKPNFDAGQLSFNAQASGVLVPAFDPEQFKSQILGKSESEVRSLVLSIPHLQDAKISLTPFWVRRVPGNKDRVTVNVQ